MVSLPVFYVQLFRFARSFVRSFVLLVLSFLLHLSLIFPSLALSLYRHFALLPPSPWVISCLFIGIRTPSISSFYTYEMLYPHRPFTPPWWVNFLLLS